jgi:transcription initiation factor IIE alpha subunit
MNNENYILVCNNCLNPHNFDKVNKKETLNGYDFKCVRCNKYTTSKKIKLVNGEI